MFLKFFASFVLLQVHLAVELPANCPVCTCPSSEPSQNFKPQIEIYSKQSNEDVASTQHPLTANHMGPNEISDSADRFSRELLQVKKKTITLKKKCYSTSVIFCASHSQLLANYPPIAEKNFVVSPFSIWSLMILVAEGAADKSLEQLKHVLHLPSYLTQFGLSYRDLRNHLFSNSTGIELDANQALFADHLRPIENSYMQILRTDYQTDYLPVDFQATDNAVNVINNHIRNKTHGKIPNLVNAASLQDTHLLLSSAIYFSGAWKVRIGQNT